MKKSTTMAFAFVLAIVIFLSFSKSLLAVDYEFLIENEVKQTIDGLTKNPDLRKVYYTYSHLISEMANNPYDEEYLLKLCNYTSMISICISKYSEDSIDDHLSIIESKTINTYEEIMAYISAMGTLSGNTFSEPSPEETNRYCSQILGQ